MQKVIFTLFDYAMCESSRKNKFTQTQPLEKQGGLLKGYIELIRDDDKVSFL